ncbi:DUF2946 domain-containing protein [Xenorhabdus anantnagensis]|uniref:DUF2946 domain-containing protein n=1 Tax=Xenorhabdus anantnagensis TaxID=3025875 RepID=A0ABT5LPD0_9GAMM|nr:DUF2946 domain-containing protein [Xenorhabdus anantnagensis]MDC9596287.1 DUF2946 domain-containing protein [Xenorhabdus anantnagensis]
MLSLFRLSQRRTPAFIALLAILMLFIAPVVSKTLEHHRENGTCESGMNHCMSMSDMQNSDNNTHHNPSYHQTSPSLHSMNHHHGSDHIHIGLMDDIACGYCQLLINLPLLAEGFVPFILLALIVSRAPPASRLSGSTIRLFYGESQPRAPPLN